MYCCNWLLAEDPWELVPGCLWTSAHAHFSFADFAFYPLVVINHSSVYDYMLSPVTPLSESSNLGIVLVIPEI